MAHDPHDVEVLSESDILAIYQSECGCVHLRVGSFTLNLTRAEFWEFVKCVGDASVRLAVRDVVQEFGVH